LRFRVSDVGFRVQGGNEPPERTRVHFRGLVVWRVQGFRGLGDPPPTLTF